MKNKLIIAIPLALLALFFTISLLYENTPDSPGTATPVPTTASSRQSNSLDSQSESTYRLAEDAADVPTPASADNVTNSNATNRLDDAIAGISRNENSSAEVSQILTEVQKLVEDGNFEEAAVALSELYNRNDELTHLERISVLDVYGNVLRAMGAGNEALAVFEHLISLSNLPEDVRLRALSGMGRLNMDSGDYESAVRRYDDWLAASDVRDPEILLGLANSLYNLNQFAEAIPPMVEHIELLVDLNEEIGRAKLMFLSVLAIETEDYDNAAWVNEIMIEQFDNMRDWRNLAAVYYFQGDEEKRIQLIEDAKAAGHMDDSGNWIE